ncbi:MAG: CDP-glycerol glycerophosphotransferase family protein [Candidatus Omnitrophica bacterium]|nr:CDP-glycerol glycerophosphotransferase family protein [Candidatus Omnitrophota bacterium]
MDNKNTKKHDMVFWAHGHNETERYLPVVVALKGQGLNILLFYQNYDLRDGLPSAQLKIIDRYEIEAIDYSYFLRKDLSLRAATLFISLFRDIIRVEFLCNKFRGLRSKLIRRRMTEDFIKKMVIRLNPKISIFDNICLTDYTDYPYGSYFIRKVSRDLGIKTLCLYHGNTGHLLEIKVDGKKRLDFEKIYAPNEYEKRYTQAICTDENRGVLALGDPRFDITWKKELKDLFSDEIKTKIESMQIGSKIKILYICPNLEHINMEDVKYKNLDDIARLSRELGNAALLVKPHPRYRNEAKIRRVMKKNKFRDFFILEDEPLLCYIDYIDFMISVTSSAIQDVLPKGRSKVIIYDNFSEAKGMTNIFKDDFYYFNRYEKLFDFLKNKIAPKGLALSSKDDDRNILDFCKRWVSAGKELDTAISDITQDMLQELQDIKGGRDEFKEEVKKA